MMKTNHTFSLGGLGTMAAMLIAGIGLLALTSAATFSPMTQGWVYLHPSFNAKPWGIASERLLDSMPDALVALRPLTVDFSYGAGNTITLLSTADGTLYRSTALYQTISDPCYDAYLEFGAPQPVALNGHSLPASGRFYIVKDSLYSFDSLKVVVPTSGRMLYLATVRTGTNSIVKLDSVNLALRRGGQTIGGVFGDADSVTRQDQGIWVTGTAGMIRNIPYASHRLGAEVVYDLSGADASAAVLYANRTRASTASGRIFSFNAGSFSLAATISPAKPVWRVYPQGAIGGSGLFKEFTGSTWRSDTAVGASSYRFANFVRKPGGFGVELLDSSWGYHAFAYRDTMTRITGATPLALMDSINRSAYIYKGPLPLPMWVQLDDPDSNYSDYSLTLNRTTDLKNDGKYAIVPLPDSESCHIGSLKMTSGFVRLTLRTDSLVVEHDCVLGALNTTCLSCYWKSYTYKRTIKWYRGSVVTIAAGTQRLNIVCEGPPVSTIAQRTGPSGAGLFRAYFTTRKTAVQFPVRQGTRVVAMAVHDLQGHVLARLLPDKPYEITAPPLGRTGVVIVSVKFSDGSAARQQVLLYR